jgi:hypothetical protein
MPKNFQIFSEVLIFGKPVAKEKCCRKLRMIENMHFCEDVAPVFLWTVQKVSIPLII